MELISSLHCAVSAEDDDILGHRSGRLVSPTHANKKGLGRKEIFIICILTRFLTG